MLGRGVRTGDSGRQTAGRYFLEGRLKSVIRVAGKSVVPEEIERAILRYPGVEEALVIGVPDPTLGEVPVAFVVPVRPELTGTLLRIWLSESMPHWKVPKLIHFVQALPRSTNGKVVRRGPDV